MSPIGTFETCRMLDASRDVAFSWHRWTVSLFTEFIRSAQFAFVAGYL